MPNKRRKTVRCAESSYGFTIVHTVHNVQQRINLIPLFFINKTMTYQNVKTCVFVGFPRLGSSTIQQKNWAKSFLKSHSNS